MISLLALADLARDYEDQLAARVELVTIGGTVFDMNLEPMVMGCVNLSRDSPYRTSVAVSVEAAVRKATVYAAQGAHIVDLGAESSTPGAPRVGPADQIAAMVPVVEKLSAVDVEISVETYYPEVAAACLSAGATLVNYSGGIPRDPAMFDVVAAHRAALLLCFIPGSDARDRLDLGNSPDMIPVIAAQLSERIASARSRGVENIVVDPGIGFAFDTSTSPLSRVQQQARTLLNTFRLRELGLPVCHSLPNAFDLFEDQFRIAEGFFAVLAQLGGCGMFRTHEVAQVVRVLRGLQVLSAR